MPHRPTVPQLNRGIPPHSDPIEEAHRYHEEVRKQRRANRKSRVAAKAATQRLMQAKRRSSNAGREDAIVKASQHDSDSDDSGGTTDSDIEADDLPLPGPEVAFIAPRRGVEPQLVTVPREVSVVLLTGIWARQRSSLTWTVAHTHYLQMPFVTKTRHATDVQTAWSSSMSVTSVAFKFAVNLAKVLVQAPPDEDDTKLITLAERQRRARKTLTMAAAAFAMGVGKRGPTKAKGVSLTQSRAMM